MDLDSTIEKRHSVRAYKDKPVSWKLVLDAIDSATKTPIAGGNQHLKFIIVEHPEKIERIARLADQLWISEAQVVVIVVSDDTQLENMFGERGRVYSRQQSGASIQNFLLKITELGLGACWVGSYDDDMLRSNFKIPSNLQVEAVIPIGYENPTEKSKSKNTKKRSLENFIYWEQWKQNKRPALFKETSAHHLPFDNLISKK